MASAAQITANRANAQASTGPITAEGKANSSRNSTSHGLTSKDVYIPQHLAAEFEALSEGLREDLNPETPLQIVFFNQALSAAWKQFLCDHAEANLYSLAATPGGNPLLDPNLDARLRTIDRARSQAARLLNTAIAALRKIQTEQQYRWASMPEEEGYETAGFGVADWQRINRIMQNEANARLEQYIFAPPPSRPAAAAPDLPPQPRQAPEQSPSRPASHHAFDPVIAEYLKACNRTSPPMQQTNPIAAAA